MMTSSIFSALLALCVGNSPVTGEFPSQRPVTRSFDVFFDLRLNKRLSKQSWGWWLETPSRSLWRHCNDQLHTCFFDSLAPVRCGCKFRSIIFKLVIQNSCLGTHCEIALGRMTLHQYWEVSIGSGYGLVPPGNKRLPELMLTQICIAICRHWTTMIYEYSTLNEFRRKATRFVKLFSVVQVNSRH